MVEKQRNKCAISNSTKESLVSRLKHAFEGKEMPETPPTVKRVLKNEEVADRVQTLCRSLVAHRKKVTAGSDSEQQFETASAEIHAEINNLIQLFRARCQTDYTDYQLVEFFLLYSGFNGDGCWDAKNLYRHLKDVRVDDGGKGSALHKFGHLDFHTGVNVWLNYWSWDQLSKPEDYPRDDMVYDALSAKGPLGEVTEKRLHYENLCCAKEVCDLVQSGKAHSREGQRRLDQLISWFQAKRPSYLSDYEVVEAMVILCERSPTLSLVESICVYVDGWEEHTHHFRLCTQWVEYGDDIIHLYVDQDFMWKFFALPVELPLS